MYATEQDYNPTLNNTITNPNCNDMIEDCKIKKGYMKLKGFKRCSITFKYRDYYKRRYGADVPWTDI